MSFELKPCPFCGEKAVLYVDNDGVRVICLECKTGTQPKVDSMIFAKAGDSAISKVMKIWNRRPEPLKKDHFSPFDNI